MTDVNISVEQILAAVLYKCGTVELKMEEMIADYSQFAISIAPGEDDQIAISLANLQGIDLEDVAE